MTDEKLKKILIREFDREAAAIDKNLQDAIKKKPQIKNLSIPSDMKNKIFAVLQSKMEDLEHMLKYAKQIVSDQNCNQNLTILQKDIKLAAIMTDMENLYDIPALQDLEWEKRNPDVIQIYRQISRMRSM